MKKNCSIQFLFVSLLVVFGVLSSCSRSSHKIITLAGSTAFQPFAEKIAENYMVTNKDVHINVQGGGSAVGIQSALSGTADIGMADLLKLPKEADGLKAITVAKDGIAVVVNPKNVVSSLSPLQTHDIFAGVIKNWKEVGGRDAVIHIISREDGSGTRRSFDEMVLGSDKLTPNVLYQDSNGTIREAVANDEDSIGYISMGILNDRVKAISYGGVIPNNKNIKSGRYPLSRPIYFLTKGEPAPLAKAFIDYVLSGESQAVLEKEGLIGVRDFK